MKHDSWIYIELTGLICLSLRELGSLWCCEYSSNTGGILVENVLENSALLKDIEFYVRVYCVI